MVLRNRKGPIGLAASLTKQAEAGYNGFSRPADGRERQSTAPRAVGSAQRCGLEGPAPCCNEGSEIVLC